MIAALLPPVLTLSKNIIIDAPHTIANVCTNLCKFGFDQCGIININIVLAIPDRANRDIIILFTCD